MCGIVGVVGHPKASELTFSMLQEIEHRGPDGNGMITYANQSMGMCRLRIRSKQAQAIPIVNKETGSYIAYNGEIYGQLGENGNLPLEPEGGPGEVSLILAAQSKNQISDIDGMYAVAQMVPDQIGIKLSRDPFGIKPIFYRKLNHGYAFSSEIKPLVKIGNKAILRDNVLAEFLAFGNPLGNQTFYKDILKVPTESSVFLTRDKAKIIPKDSSNKNSLLLQNKIDLRTALRNSIKTCLLSERKIGLALSGGLDSSILACELNALGVEEITTISVQIPGVSDGIKTLEELGLPKKGVWNSWTHKVVTVKPDELPYLIPDSISVMGQPTRMTSIPLYLKLAQAAKEEGITVLLTGEGADELFGGYPNYLEWRNNLNHFRSWEALQDFALPTQRRIWLKRLFNESVLEWCDSQFHEIYSDLSKRESLSALRALEFSLHLDPLLLRVDHCLMHYGIEGRTPYLHGHIPLIANSLPLDELLSDTETKIALRKMWGNTLSNGHAMKRKHHFRIPIASWISKCVWMLKHVENHSNTLHQLGMNAKGLSALLKEAASGDEQAASLCYSLLTFLIWYTKN